MAAAGCVQRNMPCNQSPTLKVYSSYHVVFTHSNMFHNIPHVFSIANIFNMFRYVPAYFNISQQSLIFNKILQIPLCSANIANILKVLECAGICWNMSEYKMNIQRYNRAARRGPAPGIVPHRALSRGAARTCTWKSLELRGCYAAHHAPAPKIAPRCAMTTRRGASPSPQSRRTTR